MGLEMPGVNRSLCRFQKFPWDTLAPMRSVIHGQTFLRLCYGPDKVLSLSIIHVLYMDIPCIFILKVVFVFVYKYV